MVSLPRRKADAALAPTQLTSRLLGSMLDERRLDSLGTLSILDFGRANSGSLEFFNQFPCRLCVLDAADTLLKWSKTIEDRMPDTPPSMAQMQLELSGLFSAMGTDQYDLVFLWDSLNHIHEHALPAFSNLLRRHVTPGVRGHGFLLHKRGTEPMLRRLAIAAPELISVQEQRRTTLYAHNRRVIDDALGRELKIDQGVLHSDGRLEFLILSSQATR